jgi:hypothetical protein
LALSRVFCHAAACQNLVHLSGCCLSARWRCRVHAAVRDRAKLAEAYQGANWKQHTWRELKLRQRLTQQPKPPGRCRDRECRNKPSLLQAASCLKSSAANFCLTVSLATCRRRSSSLFILRPYLCSKVLSNSRIFSSMRSSCSCVCALRFNAPGDECIVSRFTRTL